MIFSHFNSGIEKGKKTTRENILDVGCMCLVLKLAQAFWHKTNRRWEKKSEK